MSFNRRTVARTLACAMAVASFGGAATAHAATPDSLCAVDPAPALDGSFDFSNQVGSAGCVTIHVGRGVSSLKSVTNLQTGWTYTVKRAGGTSDRSRVEIAFANSATNQRLELRSELGKLVIK